MASAARRRPSWLRGDGSFRRRAALPSLSRVPTNGLASPRHSWSARSEPAASPPGTSATEAKLPTRPVHCRSDASSARPPRYHRSFMAAGTFNRCHTPPGLAHIPIQPANGRICLPRVRPRPLCLAGVVKAPTLVHQVNCIAPLLRLGRSSEPVPASASSTARSDRFAQGPVRLCIEHCSIRPLCPRPSPPPPCSALAVLPPEVAAGMNAEEEAGGLRGDRRRGPSRRRSPAGGAESGGRAHGGAEEKLGVDHLANRFLLGGLRVEYPKTQGLICKSGDNVRPETQFSLLLGKDRCGPTCGWMVKKIVVSPAHQSLSPRLNIGACNFLDLFQSFRRCADSVYRRCP